MKKLKLNLQNAEGVEVLSREELKKVAGGMMGSLQPCDFDWQCWSVDPEAICFDNFCNIKNADSYSSAGCLDRPYNEQCHSQHYGCCPPTSALGCMYDNTVFGYRCL